MPIRINLLAEAQALEEQRRRDPVKRAIRIGVLLGVLVLVYSGYLGMKLLNAKREVENLKAEHQKGNKTFSYVIDHKKKWEEANEKLGKLLQLRTNRFLNGTLLDALQHIAVNDVQLTRIRIEQKYTMVEETKTKKDAEGTVVSRGKPGSATESVVLTLEGRDNSGGDQTIKYRDAVAGSPYFQSMLAGKTNEVRLSKSEPQTGDGKYTVFTIECKFPEKVR